MPGLPIAAALLACLALAGCGGAEEPSEPALPDGFFGVNAQLLQPLPTVAREDELALHLDSLAGLEVDFARANLDWRIIEPAPPAGAARRYDFETTDAWVAALAEVGLRWQVTAQGAPTPVWARDPAAEAAGCGSAAPPARPADFAALLAEVAGRYGRDGEFWRAHPELEPRPIHQYEVWNEPNFANFWCPSPSPERYARLYAAAREAVHAVDPEAQVLFGGLAAFREVPAERAGTQIAVDDFLRRALGAVPGLAARVDVLAVHPYGQTPADVLETLAWLRATADEAGLGEVPLSVNEFGWRTMGAGGAPLADEEQRAAFVAELAPAIAASGCDVIALALHTWITPEINPVDPEHWYGIADPITAEPYPTAQAYAERVGELTADGAASGGGGVCGADG